MRTENANDRKETVAEAQDDLDRRIAESHR